MIEFQQFEKNLINLQHSLPLKPAVYTKEYPKTIKDALTLYGNQSLVNLLGSNVYQYNQHGWPIPLYVDNADIRVGLMNNIFSRIETYRSLRIHRRWMPNKKWKKRTPWNIKILPWYWVAIPVSRYTGFKEPVDIGVIGLFEANRKLVKKKFHTHPYFTGKEKILDAIFRCYETKNWTSCIYTIFPLLDAVARQVLNTNSLRKDMKAVCNLFSQIGIGIEETDVLMAHTNAVMAWAKIKDNEISKEEADVLTQKADKYKLNIIGPVLSSFLQFTNRYYGYYKMETDKSDPLNRHAILHGSYNDFATKANVVRLLTYLYLIIELGPVLSILLKDD